MDDLLEIKFLFDQDLRLFEKLVALGCSVLIDAVFKEASRGHLVGVNEIVAEMVYDVSLW